MARMPKKAKADAPKREVAPILKTPIQFSPEDIAALTFKDMESGTRFYDRVIAEDVTGEDVRRYVADFVASTVPPGSDGQIDRAAQRFGLIAAAGKLATLLGVTPWREGESREAAAWALDQWIKQRGGTEPAEIRQAIEQVRLFIEQHGDV